MDESSTQVLISNILFGLFWGVAIVFFVVGALRNDLEPDLTSDRLPQETPEGQSEDLDADPGEPGRDADIPLRPGW